MSGQTLPSDRAVDPYQFLQIVRNPDSTITRDPTRYPNTSPTPDSRDPTIPVLSKDITINPSNKTWARIFLPRKQSDGGDLFSSPKKLPLVVYFHGGGFINCSASSTVFHDFCSRLAVDLSAVVVSVDYRLAPEHRLPAAYDDAVEVLHWLRTSRRRQDSWLKEHADYSTCFILGSSSGANIAYHATLRLSEEFAGDDLALDLDQDHQPLKIRGLILHHPFIGGVQRTESEMRLVNDFHLPQPVSDLMWDLALPIGADRDHEYCNPKVDGNGGGGSRLWENLRLLGWRVLVTGYDGDPLIDRQRKLADMLAAEGVQVVSRFSEGGYHVVELKEASKAKMLFALLKDFMFSSVD